MQPDSLWYFKLKLLNYTEFIDWYIKGPRNRVAKKWGWENQSFGQTLNSFVHIRIQNIFVLLKSSSIREVMIKNISDFNRISFVLKPRWKKRKMPRIVNLNVKKFSLKVWKFTWILCLNDIEIIFGKWKLIYDKLRKIMKNV